MEVFEQLGHRWVREAERLRTRYLDEQAAHLCEVHAEELLEVMRQHSDELLTLKQAADWSGYSARTIRRWIRRGELRDRGRKNAPRIRRGDLRSKLGHLPKQRRMAEIPTARPSQIVQRVLDREDDNG